MAAPPRAGSVLLAGANRAANRSASRNRALVDDVNRRGVLRGAISLGALTLLTGCDVSEEGASAEVSARGLGLE